MKTILLTFALWVCLIGSASADWMPTFNPNQHVYIDPALVNNPAAPITFEKSLTEKLNNYKQTNYYLVAIESDQHPQGSLGVTKADDVIKAWGSLDEFPNKNYALIVWARQKENLSKGGFGKNLSPDLFVSKELDIKPIIKKNMPSNPQGAFLDIVSSIDRAINFAYWSAIFLLGAVVTGLLSVFALFLGIPKAIELRLTRKKRASTELLRQKEYAEKINQRLLSLDSEDLLSYYLKSDPYSRSVISANKDYYQIAVLVKTFNTVIDEATTLFDRKDYLGVINLFDSQVVIDFSQGDKVDSTQFLTAGRLEYIIKLRMSVFEDNIKVIDQAKDSLKFKKVPPVASPSSINPPKPATVRKVVSNSPKSEPSQTSVYIDTSTHSTNFWDSSSYSSSSSSSDFSSSSSDWGSSGSDYLDSGSSGGDY